MIKKMTNGSRNVLVVCGTVMFCFIAGLSVAVLRFASDGPTALGVITVLFTQLGVTIAALTLVVKGEATKVVAADTNQKVDRILNGEMQEKVEQAVQTKLIQWLQDEHARPKQTGKTP